MCRLAAWIGDPISLEEVVIRPSHSLLEQSQDANEAKLSVNGDGFGIAWYNGKQGPGLFRDILPAWSDRNLTSLCHMIRSELFFAHVRAATGGGLSRANCHPFTFGRWSFMHNGQIGAFGRKRRRLEACLPDDLYEIRAGTADSEVLFLLLLAHGLESDPILAVDRVLGLLAEMRGPRDAPDRLTCVMTDGSTLYAFRYASDGRCPTLYERVIDKGDATGTLLASEPLDETPKKWRSLAPGQLLHVSAEVRLTTPLAVSEEFV